MNRSFLVVVGCALFVLAGCAKVGLLERPAPLFGEKAKARYQADKAATAAAAHPPADTEPEPLPGEASSTAAGPEANPPVSGTPDTANGQRNVPPPAAGSPPPP